MQFKRRLKKDASIEIASLVDIVFLLLLFFVVTTTFRETPGLEIDLPETHDATGVELKDVVVNVVLGQSGAQVIIDDEPIPIEELQSYLRNELQQRPEDKRAVVVQADKNVRFELVYRVFDIAREAGATGITVPAEFRERENQ